MTQDALSIIQILFSSIWSLFTSWYIPGTNVTPAGMFMFLLFAFFVLRWVKHLFFINKEDDD